MADPFTRDAFYTSARNFALRALEAQHAGDHRCVPLFAGTAVEHLAKACLARRSPALLVEMNRNSGFISLIALLRLEEGAGVPASIRTIGLSEALYRVRRFVNSKANQGDLEKLIGMRNGVVHAADENEVEESILTAFVQEADSLLCDLGREREDFWGVQLAVVDALLADASNKLQHRIGVKLAQAEAMFQRRYEAEGEAVIRALAAFFYSTPLTGHQRFRDCPVCGYEGIATGEYTLNWTPSDWDEVGEVASGDHEIWFIAQKFHCQVCHLRLDSGAEMEAAGIEPRWPTEDVDWTDFGGPIDDDVMYEHYREEREGLEGR